MNKRFLKFLSKLFSKPIVQVGFYIFGIFVIFLISGVFDDVETSVSKIMNILSAQETISVFLQQATAPLQLRGRSAIILRRRD